MASQLRRRRARQKLASVAFLSSISLDGENRDLNRGSIVKCDHIQSEAKRRFIHKKVARQDGKIDRIGSDLGKYQSQILSNDVFRPLSKVFIT